MQLNWKIVTVTIIIVLLSILGSGIFHRTDNRVIETYSAKIIQESERIVAPEDCAIADIAVKNSEAVTVGQPILEIRTGLGQACKDKSNLSDKKTEATNEYQDAAIMYKDGIISQEEYDKSLDEYKNTSAEISKESACNNKTEKIHASKDGILDLLENQKGAYIKKDETIAVIKPAKRRILAYFSQKFSKKLKAGMLAEITLIKYPEKQFTGVVEAVDKIDLNGIPVIIKINENVSDLNIDDDDDAVVRIIE